MRLSTTAAMFVLNFAVLFAGSTALAQWDVAADYSTTTNPGPLISGGQWGYGQTRYDGGGTPDASMFILYDENGFDPSGTIQVWQDGPSPSVDTLGGVSTNTTGAFHANFGIDWEPLEIDLMPDITKTVASTAKLTVPTTGTYTVDSTFADNQGGTGARESDAWVFSDTGGTTNVLFGSGGTLLPSNGLTHATGTVRAEVDYDGTVFLNAGDSLYFASGAFGAGGDHAILTATVSIPEPSSVVLTLLGCTALIGFARRRRS